MPQVRQLRRTLTEQEQAIVDAAELKNPGTGVIIAVNLSNSESDWADVIASMTVEEAIEAIEFIGNSLSRCG